MLPGEVDDQEAGLTEVVVALELVSGAAGVGVFHRAVGFGDGCVGWPVEAGPTEGSAVAAQVAADPGLKFRRWQAAVS